MVSGFHPKAVDSVSRNMPKTPSMTANDVREVGYIGRYRVQTNGFFMTHKRKIPVKDSFVSASVKRKGGFRFRKPPWMRGEGKKPDYLAAFSSILALTSSSISLYRSGLDLRASLAASRPWAIWLPL